MRKYTTFILVRWCGIIFPKIFEFGFISKSSYRYFCLPLNLQTTQLLVFASIYRISITEEKMQLFHWCHLLLFDELRLKICIIQRWSRFISVIFHFQHYLEVGKIYESFSIFMKNLKIWTDFSIYYISE